MTAVQPPSLPYVRDEASTSQLLSSYHQHQQAAQYQQQPSAYGNGYGQAYGNGGGYDNYALTSNGTEDPDDMYDEEVIDDRPEEEPGVNDGSALQYWAAKRHMVSKKIEKGEEEYSKSRHRHSSREMAIVFYRR